MLPAAGTPKLTVVPEVLWIQGLDGWDGLVRPKISYELRGNTMVWFGADLFYGSRAGLLGQFDGTDRVLVGFEVGI